MKFVENVSFRFLFLFFVATMSPWYMLYSIPGASYLLDMIQTAEGFAVDFLNDKILHIKDTLNRDGGGSGDTSYAWAFFYTSLLLSLVGSLLWSLFDRKRSGPSEIARFWLGNLIRYYLASVSFSYGTIKLFALQMPAPNLSQLATPLGDFLPMRLSWMFFGYSSTYQIFSGVMEMLVAILLMYRNTVSLGALMGVGVFANVFLINISYDVPVKLYSMELLILFLFLAGRDWKRITDFFLFNRTAEPSTVYQWVFEKKGYKILRIVLKTAFIIMFAVMPLVDSWRLYQDEVKPVVGNPIPFGLYNVATIIKNGDTLSVQHHDETIWKDFIFDKGGLGSVHTTDTLFRQRYRRGYFFYQPDTLNNLIEFKKSTSDSIPIFRLAFQRMNDTTLVLWGKVRDDSLRFELKKNNRHFQLTEKQFHWISESNR